MDHDSRILAYIAGCTSPDDLLGTARNARRLGNTAVERAARLRLYAILPAAEPGTLEYDVWQSIHGLEDTLSTERRRTTRLARTRQSIGKIGEVATVEKLLLKPQVSDGFHMLVERDMTELTFEAVALRHPSRFSEAALAAALRRLKSLE